jgi:hypothetical protein
MPELRESIISDLEIVCVAVRRQILDVKRELAPKKAANNLIQIENVKTKLI